MTSPLDSIFINCESVVVHSLINEVQALFGLWFLACKYLYIVDMNAIRRDEEVDNLHSIYVDQWTNKYILLPKYQIY